MNCPYCLCSDVIIYGIYDYKSSHKSRHIYHILTLWYSWYSPCFWPHSKIISCKVNTTFSQCFHFQFPIDFNHNFEHMHMWIKINIFDIWRIQKLLFNMLTFRFYYYNIFYYMLLHTPHGNSMNYNVSTN